MTAPVDADLTDASLEDFDPDAPGQLCDADHLFGLPHDPANAKVVVMPVPFEATTSFGRGTVGGPAAILSASLQVDLHDAENGDFWRAGIAMLPFDPEVEALNLRACEAALPVIAAGGANGDPELEALTATVNAIGAELNEIVYRQTRDLLRAGRIPAILGGDHAVPFGAHRAVIEHLPEVGLLHIDAHADLRVAYEGFTWSHASILYNTLANTGLKRVVQVGIRDFGQREQAMINEDPRICCWKDIDLAWELAGGETWSRLCGRIVADLPRDVWITFDIDGLDPTLCPSTGTPVPGGLSWHQALVLLRTVVDHGHRIVGFDLVEVGDAPWDANVGARLLYKLAGHAIRSQLPA